MLGTFLAKRDALFLNGRSSMMMENPIFGKERAKVDGASPKVA